MAKKMFVIDVPIVDAINRAKVRKIVAGFHGISSVGDENGKITVVGDDGVDPVKITRRIRRQVCKGTQLVLVKPLREEEEENRPPSQVVVQPSYHTYPYGGSWYYCYDI